MDTSTVTTRRNFMLAVLATADPDVLLGPTQVQKLFFLLDEEASHLTGGPHFRFRPEGFGSYDGEVYEELRALGELGLARIVEGRYRQYAVSFKGWKLGTEALGQFEPKTQEYFATCHTWVRSLPFEHLVGAIYGKYPRMRQNAVFA